MKLVKTEAIAFVNAREVAKVLKTSYWTVLSLADFKKIRGYKMGAMPGRRGGRWRFLLPEVIEDFRKEYGHGIS